jgi:hypothetical protein
MNRSNTYVVLSTIDLHLNNSRLLEIIKANDVTLDEVSADLLTAFKDKTLGPIYMSCLYYDITYMSDLSCLDIDRDDLNFEFNLLVNSIQEKISSINISDVKLRNIYLEIPDTLILEYSK